jgi:hypothetical protein
MTDPTMIEGALAVKLGSAIVHADEAMGEQGHAADEAAFRSILSDPDVAQWLDSMHALSLLPLKRGQEDGGRHGG